MIIYKAKSKVENYKSDYEVWKNVTVSEFMQIAGILGSLSSGFTELNRHCQSES